MLTHQCSFGSERHTDILGVFVSILIVSCVELSDKLSIITPRDMSFVFEMKKIMKMCALVCRCDDDAASKIIFTNE